MTTKEYITQSLQAFDIKEYQLIDLSLEHGIDLEAEYNEDVQKSVGVALCHTIEGLINQPRLASINENGFSMSWDYSNLGKYYLWLCRKWGVKPNSDTMAGLGINAIIDRTKSW